MASADEEFIKQLREVFDLCDELKCGIISVNQLRDIVRKHFGGSEEEVVQLIECLDPNQHGVVTFADFCRGVQSTLQIKGVNFEEAALRSQQWERRGRRKLHLPGTFIPARQQFRQLPERQQSRQQPSVQEEEELPDAQQVGLQETFLQCIGQLHRNGSRRNSQSSDEYPLDVPMSIEDDVLDLNQKVNELQQQVATLTDNQMNTDERYIKVKQENAALQNK
ncbi:unnamed protein product, partial [Larinioides sclopetarius]